MKTAKPLLYRQPFASTQNDIRNPQFRYRISLKLIHQRQPFLVEQIVAMLIHATRKSPRFRGVGACRVSKGGINPQSHHQYRNGSGAISISPNAAVNETAWMLK